MPAYCAVLRVSTSPSWSTRASATCARAKRAWVPPMSATTSSVIISDRVRDFLHMPGPVGIMSPVASKRVGHPVKGLDLKNGSERRVRRARHMQSGRVVSPRHHHRCALPTEPPRRFQHARIACVLRAEEEHWKILANEFVRTVQHLGTAVGFCVNPAGLLQLVGCFLRDTQVQPARHGVEMIGGPEPFAAL